MAKSVRARARARGVLQVITKYERERERDSPSFHSSGKTVLSSPMRHPEQTPLQDFCCLKQSVSLAAGLALLSFFEILPVPARLSLQFFLRPSCLTFSPDLAKTVNKEKSPRGILFHGENAPPPPRARVLEA